MGTTSVITKTYFTRGDNCPLATVNSLRCPEEATTPDLNYIFDNGHRVGELARKLFPGSVTVELGTHSAMARDTRHYIDQGIPTICEASFFNEGLFAAVDVLKFTAPGHVSIYEVKSSTEIKDIYYRDLAFQVYLVRSCGYTVDAAYLVYINGEFVKNGEIDVNQFFITANVTEDVMNIMDQVKADIDVIRDLLEKGTTIDPPIGSQCFTPYACQYWKKCRATMPMHSIFDISGGMRNSTKIKLFYNGVPDMESFLTLKGQNPKFVQQARLEVDGSDVIEYKEDELKEFLDSLKFPLTSLDFETIIPAIPVFDGMKPYDQTVTQFSMHILRELGGNLEHHEFLANPDDDWRHALAHKLVQACPFEGSVLVWNKTMEYHRIMELAEMPCNTDIKSDLISIADRIVDLMVPFRQRVVYNRQMHGSYSLKYVLPALCPNEKDLDYTGLSINNGMIASMAFTELMDSSMSDIQAASTRRDLLTYCELDTYGPFNILEKLYKLIDPSSKKLFVKSVRHDHTNKTLRIGDRVSTNVGTGSVVGFTRCFVRVRCDDRINRLRKPHNLYNLSGMEIPEVDGPTIETISEKPVKFYDVTGREVHEGDFVTTNSVLGKVIGRTPAFLKIQLTDGKTVLRNGTFTIIS